jgi:hypothetical protein
MDKINQVYPTITTKPNGVWRRSSVPGGVGSMRILQSFCLAVVLSLMIRLSVAEETNLTSASPSPSQADTNSVEILRTLAGLVDQLHSNQVAIEETGRELKEATAQNANLVAKGFQNMQETFSTQQQVLSERNSHELQAMQSSNRVVVMAGAMFATVVALTLFLIVYFQWRISKAWTHISDVLPGSRRLSGGGAAVLGPGEKDAAGSADASNARFLHAVAALEHRVQGLEQNAGSSNGPRSSHHSAPGNGDSTVAPRQPVPPTAANAEQAVGKNQPRISAWLDQGQSMLKQNDWQAALQCFDEVLALDPNHSEALVKKGAALERLKKLTEAFECYDRAIAADESMTIAYLHKGGLCSRLERFKEALECYEKALRTHTDWGS